MLHAFFAAALLAVASAPTPAASAAPALPDYPALMKAAKVPGMQVLVIRDGAVASNTSYGVRDIGTNAPVDENTHFEIGSITKQFTAAAILQLRDAGKLSLDDKLGKYFPQYARAKDITLRQMLLQISGIPDFTDVKPFGAMIKKVSGRYIVTKHGSLAGVIALIKNMPLDFKPGTKWEYSNSNYFLLGEVVAKVAKMPWEQYIAQNIFAKAGMTQSAFMKDEPHIADMATGYVIENGKDVPGGNFNGWAEGAGGIVSTASDMAKWDLAFFGGKVIPAQDVALATSPGALPAMGKSHYGFGWLVDTYDGQSRLWHNGGTLGFNASLQTYPALGQTIIVLSSAGLGADSIAQTTFDALHPDLAAANAKPAVGEDAAITARIKTIYAQLLSGKPDRSQFNDAANKAFTPQIIAAADAQLGQLGDPTSWVFKAKRTQGGLTAYRYRVTYASGTVLSIVMAIDKDNKVAAYFFTAASD